MWVSGRGISQPGYGGYGRLRSEIEKHLIARQDDACHHLQAHFERLWRDETPMPNDQLCAGRREVLRMQFDLVANHLALVAQNRWHVDRDAACGDTECADRYGPDGRPWRSRVRSCSACRRCWGRSRRPTGAPPAPRAARSRARCHAISWPPCPLPRTSTSNCSR